MRFLKIAICFILLSSPCSAQLISYPPQKIMGFRGLDTSSNAPLLEDGRAVDMKNVKLSTAYDLKKRYGYSTINNASLDDYDLDSPAVTGIFDARFADGTNFPIIFVGNKIKYDNSTVWTEIGDSWASPTVTSNKNYQWQCAMALDVAICTDDYDLPLKISSTPGKSLLFFTGLTDAITKVKSITWFRNYLILGNTVEGGSEKPTRIRWSAVGGIEAWTDEDYNDLAELGGDEITGFAELYGNLYVFLKNAIYKITLVGGDDVFSFDKVIDGYGAISRDSIQVVRLGNNTNGIIFLDEDKKVFLFNGLTLFNIGQLIQPTLDNLSAARLQYAVSSYDNKSYYLSVSDGSASEHDLLLEYQVEINEWTKHTNVNANAMARVKDSSTIKTYFGNYDSFVYWLDNPDNKNDVDGAVGIIDSIGYTTLVNYITGGQVIIDTGLTSGAYTGAILKITSGAASGEERVILASTTTSLVVGTAFSTTPDSTSNYSIGVIDSEYQTKWYDFGDSPRKKNFKELFFWAKEASSNTVTINHSRDFGSTVDSQEKSLSPSSSSLWDTALWDEGVWGTTGDKFYRIPLKGHGRNISLDFSNNDADETFHIYGFNILADALDIR